MSLSTLVRILLIPTIFFLLISSAVAQYGASLEGTVTDKSGAVVGGAMVTITDQATGVTRNTVSGQSGFYRIAGLPPGRYRVDVEAASFKKTSTPNVPVVAEATNPANVVLQTGSASETVTVSGESQALETENASIGNTLTSQQIVDLPEFGRDLSSCRG